MTTVGVPAEQPWRVDALRFPSYNYHYHAFKEKQRKEYRDAVLAKPSPRYRRVSMDFALKEQQRQNGALVAKPGSTRREKKFFPGSFDGIQPDKDDVASLPIIPATPPTDLLVRARLCPKEYARWRYETTPVVTTDARAEWNRFLLRCPERFEIELPRHTEDCRVYNDPGYAMRYLVPFRTRGIGMQWERQEYLYTIPGPSVPSPYRSIQFEYQPISKSETLSV